MWDGWIRHMPALCRVLSASSDNNQGSLLLAQPRGLKAAWAATTAAARHDARAHAPGAPTERLPGTCFVRQRAPPRSVRPAPLCAASLRRHAPEYVNIVMTLPAVLEPILHQLWR
jgi:hypothetical protein